MGSFRDLLLEAAYEALLRLHVVAEEALLHGGLRRLREDMRERPRVRASPVAIALGVVHRREHRGSRSSSYESRGRQVGSRSG